MAELVPDSTETILDLGRGTGLELDKIFKRMPSVSVVGVDLTQAMLASRKQPSLRIPIRSITGSFLCDFMGCIIHV